ncbi:hypothetical protein GCM10017711_13590 [Paeniglutamicibacter sulfureus]
MSRPRGRTVFRKQRLKGEPAPGPGVRHDAVMDRGIHDTIWIDAGSCDMREKTGTVGHGGIRWGSWCPQRQYRWHPSTIMGGPRCGEYSMSRNRVIFPRN